MKLIVMKTGTSCYATLATVIMVLALLPPPLHAQFAYVANRGGPNISGYTINATTGALTPISGSPFAAVGAVSVAVALTPNVTYASKTTSSFSASWTASSTDPTPQPH